MKKILLVIFLSLIVVLSACSQNQSSNSESFQNNSKVDSSDDGFKNIDTSIDDLLKEGKPSHCIVNIKGEQDGGSGTFSEEIFIDKNRMFLELKYDSDSNKGNFYTIDDGEFIYTWNSITKTGMKMPRGDEEDYEQYDDLDEDDMSVSSPDLKSTLSLKCERWTVDNRKFIPPSDISFTDFSSIEQLYGSLE